MKKLILMLLLVMLASSCSGGSGTLDLVKGHGLFIWQLYNIGPLSSGEKTIEFAVQYDKDKPVIGQSVSLETVIERCKRAKADWVVIKLGDSDALWLREKSSIEGWLKAQNLTFRQMIDAFHRENIKVHGFHYIYGSNMHKLSTEVDCARQIIESGIDGYFVDAELDVELALNPTQTMEDFFSGIKDSPSFSNILIGYTTFGQLSKHHRIPYKVFEKYCDVFIPQCYWIDRDPDCKMFSPEIEMKYFREDLRMNRDGKGYRLTKSGSDESIIPAGSVESEVCRGTHAQSVDIVRFKDILKRDFPTGECWWSLDWMNDSDLDTIGTW